MTVITMQLPNELLKSELLKSALPYRLNDTHFDFAKRYQGKVRDCYTLDDQLVMITTDRLSAFDRVLCTVPFKGQILNLLSAWWFDHTRHIIDNAKITVLHPNVMVAKPCRVFPVEFVMRGYMTGSTDTSLWALYQQGLRAIDDCLLPDHLKKNAALPRPLLTPTTKSTTHDEPVTLADIVERGLMTQDELTFVSQKARELYAFGAALSSKNGLILVDTKYEFGRNALGDIVLVDEIHTPDSSRYWQASTYQERFLTQLEPESYDKEILRLWMKQHADPYKDVELPVVPDEVILQLSARYIDLYERITGETFPLSAPDQALSDTIKQRVLSYLRR